MTNPLGIRPGDDATALPSSLVLGASFDVETAEETGHLLGRQARAKGFTVQLAGGANLVREATGGWNFEYIAEDPLLTGRLAGASVAAIQAEGVVSTMKHFTLNAQETGRVMADSRIEEAAHRESDLLAFQTDDNAREDMSGDATSFSPLPVPEKYLSLAEPPRRERSRRRLPLRRLRPRRGERHLDRQHLHRRRQTPPPPRPGHALIRGVLPATRKRSLLELSLDEAQSVWLPRLLDGDAAPGSRIGASETGQAKSLGDHHRISLRRPVSRYCKQVATPNCGRNSVSSGQS